jgi:hypothetical protein
MPVVPLKEAPLPWYYTISAMLGEGSIIEPGNWGRMLRMKQEWGAEDRDKWSCEMTYDEARKLFAPNAVSRLNALFACPTRADAEAFVQLRKTDLIYEVEPTKEVETATVLNWSLFKFPRGPNQVSQWMGDAQIYWTTIPTGSRELLCDIPVRVIKRL